MQQQTCNHHQSQQHAWAVVSNAFRGIAQLALQPGACSSDALLQMHDPSQQKNAT
jgi:hypothetical protein